MEPFWEEGGVGGSYGKFITSSQYKIYKADVFVARVE